MAIDTIMFILIIIITVIIVVWDMHNEEKEEMGNQTDYFERVGYKPKYHIGDRVFGYWNKVPFVGAVGNDRLINENTGPEITIHLDLPMRLTTGFTSFIIVKHKDIKQTLKVIE